MKLLPTEHQVQTSIIHYLRARGFYVIRLNSGKYSVGEGRYKRFINGAEKGTPDLVAFQPLHIKSPFEVKPVKGIAVLYFIEVKRPNNKPTLPQKMKMKELEDYGAKCLVIHSVEELERINL